MLQSHHVHTIMFAILTLTKLLTIQVISCGYAVPSPIFIVDVIGYQIPS